MTDGAGYPLITPLQFILGTLILWLVIAVVRHIRKDGRR